jgi:hypothetical protein
MNPTDLHNLKIFGRIPIFVRTILIKSPDNVTSHVCDLAQYSSGTSQYSHSLRTCRLAVLEAGEAPLLKAKASQS